MKNLKSHIEVTHFVMHSMFAYMVDPCSLTGDGSKMKCKLVLTVTGTVTDVPQTFPHP